MCRNDKRYFLPGLLLLMLPSAAAYSGTGNKSNTAIQAAVQPLVQDPWMAVFALISMTIFVTSLYFIYQSIQTLRRDIQ